MSDCRSEEHCLKKEYATHLSKPRMLCISTKSLLYRVHYSSSNMLQNIYFEKEIYLKNCEDCLLRSKKKSRGVLSVIKIHSKTNLLSLISLWKEKESQFSKV